MKTLLEHARLPCITTAIKLEQVKKEIDQILPKVLHAHYQISQLHSGQPVVVVYSAIWMLQIRQYETSIQNIISNYFEQNKLLTWKIKPQMTLA